MEVERIRMAGTRVHHHVKGRVRFNGGLGPFGYHEHDRGFYKLGVGHLRWGDGAGFGFHARVRGGRQMDTGRFHRKIEHISVPFGFHLHFRGILQ